MSDNKTPFSEAYVKRHRAFLQATIIIFGSLGILAAVRAYVLSQQSTGTVEVLIGYLTTAVLFGFWATTAIFRKATLAENVEIFKAIKSSRDKE